MIAAADRVAVEGISGDDLPPGRNLLQLKKYRGVAVPTTLVLDRQHRVAAFFVGGVLETDVVPVVRQVTAEA